MKVLRVRSSNESRRDRKHPGEAMAIATTLPTFAFTAQVEKFQVQLIFPDDTHPQGSKSHVMVAGRVCCWRVRYASHRDLLALLRMIVNACCQTEYLIRSKVSIPDWVILRSRATSCRAKCTVRHYCLSPDTDGKKR